MNKQEKQTETHRHIQHNGVYQREEEQEPVKGNGVKYMRLEDLTLVVTHMMQYIVDVS